MADLERQAGGWIRTSVLRRIRREHLLRALADLDEGADHAFGFSTGYDLIHEGRVYVPKAVLGLAARYAFGTPLEPADFSGGEYSACFRVLREHGFVVQPKSDAPSSTVGSRTWIFQGNPKQFRIDEYLSLTKEICWTVRQERLAPLMAPGDLVYIWRSEGDGKDPGGIIASGKLTSAPRDEFEDPAAVVFWNNVVEGTALRVRITLDRVADKKSMIKRDWLKEDPVAKDLRIIKLASETNFEVSSRHAARLASLWRNTGRDWTEDESAAGLWAYAHTNGGEVSRLPGSPVAEVAVRIGRAATGVYNKVMNFRAIDPTNVRTGLAAAGQADRVVWARYFDANTAAIDLPRLDADYERVWGLPPAAGDGPPPSDPRPERIGGLRGQGYETDPAVRRAIEKMAMDRAEAHYEAEGFTVEVTADRYPFDLRCTKECKEVRVEVKGTRSDGTSILVTIGEVRNARGSGWRTDLFIVSELRVAGDPPIATGGTVRRIEGWCPTDDDLDATQFRCTPRG